MIPSMIAVSTNVPTPATPLILFQSMTRTYPDHGSWLDRLCYNENDTLPEGKSP